MGFWSKKKLATWVLYLIVESTPSISANDQRDEENLVAMDTHEPPSQPSGIFSDDNMYSFECTILLHTS